MWEFIPHTITYARACLAKLREARAKESNRNRLFGIAKNLGLFGNGLSHRDAAAKGRAVSGLNALSLSLSAAGDIPAGLVPPMARALGVSVDELLGETEKKRHAAIGPTGRMRRLFEAASKLPRPQQPKIAAVIEAFVNQHSDREK